MRSPYFCIFPALALEVVIQVCSFGAEDFFMSGPGRFVAGRVVES